MQNKNIVFYFLHDLVCFKIFNIGRELNSVFANIVYFNCPLWLHYISWFSNTQHGLELRCFIVFVSLVDFIYPYHGLANKCLGVQIDEKLTWQCHIYMICNRASAGVGAMKRIKAFVPIDTLEEI